MTLNALTIDVEDYFQVSAFEKVSPVSEWDSFQLRVQSNTEKILDSLSEKGLVATFFVLGWVAQRCPELIKKIAAQGHEIASHGFGHRRIGELSRIEFREDILSSKKLLEDLSGQEVIGYRAPSYSITAQTNWAFGELVDAGYHYDSSVFPIRHDFYGLADWPRLPFFVEKTQGGGWQPRVDSENGDSQQIFEIPITTIEIKGKNFPIAGGGYFRLFPYAFTRWGLRRINRKDASPFVFYLHPWEFDPEQPRFSSAGLKSRFRHYINLQRTEPRFLQLIDDFRFGPLKVVFADQLKLAKTNKTIPRGSI